MTATDIQTLLATTGLPASYLSFPEDNAPDPPFICWYFPGSADLYADNINYGRINELTIELYTAEKDLTREAALETILIEANIPFARSETWIDSERLYQITYETEVIIHASEQD